MKRIFTLAALMSFFGLTACGQAQKNDRVMDIEKDAKVLVAYFSATGTTKDVASTIAGLTGGTLHEIVPETPYTDADLDWRDSASRSSREMNDPACRPPVREAHIDMTPYDTVFIGFPVWWDVAPMVVNTFIEANDLKGKVIYPFATSGGSSIDGSVRDFRSRYPSLDWRGGRLLRRGDRRGVEAWLDSL